RSYPATCCGLDVARSSCEFILRDLQRLRPSSDELCFSYTPLDSRWVHNANILGASLLAAVAAETSENTLRDAALAAARYTARRQHTNGSWPYGENPQDKWVDNFHTAYVLVCLKKISHYLSTDAFERHLSAGYSYWTSHMFLPDGQPKY